MTSAHRRPKAHIDPVSGLIRWAGNFRCACGKSAFLSRKAARGSMRRTFPGESMQVYRCDRGPFEVWHFGHARGHEREQ